jgi:hypothetical protein
VRVRNQGFARLRKTDPRKSYHCFGVLQALLKVACDTWPSESLRLCDSAWDIDRRIWFGGVPQSNTVLVLKLCLFFSDKVAINKENIKCVPFSDSRSSI